MDNTPALPSLKPDDLQSDHVTAKSLTAAGRREGAVDVSRSSLSLGASVECASSDAAPPAIMLGKCCCCVKLANVFCVVVRHCYRGHLGPNTCLP